MWKGASAERDNSGPRKNEALNMAMPVRDVIVNIFKHPNQELLMFMFKHVG